MTAMFSDPKPKSNMDKLGWCLKNEDKKRCLSVEDWIIEGGQSPDDLHQQLPTLHSS